MTPVVFAPTLAAILVALTGCGRVAFEPLATQADAQNGDARALDASAETCNPVAPFGTPVLIAELSDPTVADGTLRLMPDELSGYFWRNTPAGRDILLATRPSLTEPFTVTAVQGLEQGDNELDPTPSSDGTVLVFRRNSPGDDLYVATRMAPDLFGTPVALATLNTGSAEGQGFLPIGIDELYFQSKRSGAGDLYTSVRSGTSFAAPALVTELATAAEEGDPVVTPDGLTIYFRTDATAIQLGFNIASASRSTADGVFGAPALVPNVNTDSDDGPSWISSDGCRLYLSSDAAGTNDVYVATRGM